MHALELANRKENLVVIAVFNSDRDPNSPMDATWAEEIAHYQKHQKHLGMVPKSRDPLQLPTTRWHLW